MPPPLAPRDAFLTTAFWFGSRDRADAILAAQPELARDPDIHVAAALGDAGAVGRLLARDPSLVRATDAPRGVEPLVQLCFSVYLQHDRSRDEAFVRAARMLLDAGADPNGGFFDGAHTPRPERESVLYGAAGVAHHATLTKLLLERGAEPNDEEVPYHAPETRDNAALRILVDSGKLSADSLVMMLLRKTDWHDLDGVRLLLDGGAEVNRATRFGRTALHQAIARDNRLAIIDLLLDRGADARLVSRASHFGPARTGVALAARRGRGDVLAALERRGVGLDLDGVDRLIALCARADASEARRLAEREPGLVERLQSEGASLLAEFAGNDNPGGVALLLDLGVPIDARYSGDGYFAIPPQSTALHVAAWRAAHDAVALLLSRGADPNARDGKGATPLMRAVQACVDSWWSDRRSPRSVRALLDAGASRAGVPLPTGWEELDRLIGAR